MVLVVKNLPAKAGDVRDAASVPGLGRSLGGGHSKVATREEIAGLRRRMDSPVSK